MGSKLRRKTVTSLSGQRYPTSPDQQPRDATGQPLPLPLQKGGLHHFLYSQQTAQSQIRAAFLPGSALRKKFCSCHVHLRRALWPCQPRAELSLCLSRADVLPSAPACLAPDPCTTPSLAGQGSEPERPFKHTISLPARTSANSLHLPPNLPRHSFSALMLQTQRCRTAHCNALAQPHDVQVCREPLKSPKHLVSRDRYLQLVITTLASGRLQNKSRHSPVWSGTAWREALQPGSECLPWTASPGVGMGTPGHAAAMWIQTLQ